MGNVEYTESQCLIGESEGIEIIANNSQLDYLRELCLSKAFIR